MVKLIPAARVRRMIQLARVCAFTAIAIATLVLVGWLLDLPMLKSLHADLVSMKVNTAIGLIAGGVSLWLCTYSHTRFWMHWLQRASAWTLVILGTLTLGQYLLNINLGIDELLIPDDINAVGTLSPGRMAASTASSFLLLGSAILIDNLRPQWWRDAALLAALLIVLFALVGYAYGVSGLHGVAAQTRMALHTASALFVLVLGVFMAEPGRGLMSLLAGDGASARVACRLLLVATLLPILIGWLTLQGAHAGWYGHLFATSLLVVVLIVIISAAVLWNAAALEKSDWQRRQLESGYRMYADVANNSPVGMTVWRLLDPEDARSLTLAACNPAAERLLGMRLRDRIGETMPQVFPGAAATPDLQAFADVVRGQHAIEFGELEGRDESTLGRIYRVRAFPLPEQMLGFSFEDVTDLKAAEAQLRRERDAADAANRELEAFSYSVSHDLRAPLRGIDGFSRALLEDHAAELNDEAKFYLRRICAGAQRMGELIDDLIKLSRVSRGDLQRERVDLSRLAEDICREFRQAEPARSVSVQIETGMLADGDPKLLRVALENLLGNAWKFTSRRADAQIEFRIDGERDGRPVYMLRDNGAGFDMSYADKLFGAFQRLHGAEEFPGTGIGLATVQRVIRRHGGQIRAEGHPNAGATFHFTLA